MRRTSDGEAFSGAFHSLSTRAHHRMKKFMLTCDYLADNLMVDFHHHAL
jgi:hypothetical protein